MKVLFEKAAARCSRAMGSYLAFLSAAAMTIAWAVSWRLWSSVDMWLLIINTITTIITFLAVFLIQNGQNRSDAATHAKLDEIIRAMPPADDRYRGAEEMSDDEIRLLRASGSSE